MNIYIKAMEIGSKNLEKGITFPKLKSEIEKQLKIEFTYASELNFVMWFLENFADDEVYSIADRNHTFISNYKRYLIYHNRTLLNNIEIQDIRNDQKVTTPHSHYQISIQLNYFFIQTFFLKGATNKQYIDYLELKESRESSKEALKKANISIWVAAIALIISAGFSVAEYFKPEPNYPQPPFEVKVKEPIEVKQPILIDTTNYGTIQTD